jgi:hypothetical protein
MVVGPNPEKIVRNIQTFKKFYTHPQLYGDGYTVSRYIALLRSPSKKVTLRMRKKSQTTLL